MTSYYSNDFSKLMDKILDTAPNSPFLNSLDELENIPFEWKDLASMGKDLQGSGWLKTFRYAINGKTWEITTSYAIANNDRTSIDIVANQGENVLKFNFGKELINRDESEELMLVALNQVLFNIAELGI